MILEKGVQGSVACRACNNPKIDIVLDLGEQCFTGVFPMPGEEVESVPLRLARCSQCTLVQLADAYDLDTMYGDGYGYRSGLNKSMVSHLTSKAKELEAGLSDGSAVMDIGSNDGTLLGVYSDRVARRVGVDPSLGQFKSYYRGDEELHEAFFGAKLCAEQDFKGQFDLITSISMFYDLPDPQSFVLAIADCLKANGRWHFEQSYLLHMLENTSYDTVCHEHLEYYSLKVIADLLTAAELEIIDIGLNKINGGSVAITASKKGAYDKKNIELLEWLEDRESIVELSLTTALDRFGDDVRKHIKQLRSLVENINASGKSVAGYGASTKGNVILQACGLGANHLKCIYEVNDRKFGCVTPGSSIPIKDEACIRDDAPDYLLVLPWHFREFLIPKLQAYRERGGRIIFPLPTIEVI